MAYSFALSSGSLVAALEAPVSFSQSVFVVRVFGRQPFYLFLLPAATAIQSRCVSPVNDRGLAVFSRAIRPPNSS